MTPRQRIKVARTVGKPDPLPRVADALRRYAERLGDHEAALVAEAEALVEQKRRAGDLINEAWLVAELLGRHEVLAGHDRDWYRACAREYLGRVVRRVLGRSPEPGTEPCDLTGEEWREQGDRHHQHAEALARIHGVSTPRSAPGAHAARRRARSSPCSPPQRLLVPAKSEES